MICHITFSRKLFGTALFEYIPFFVHLKNAKKLSLTSKKTGGKATKDTVKKSFDIILKDPRVNTIFVNIFGGLTLCDMIAEGILLAYKDLGIKVPVVVRLRGTNEDLGQKMVSCDSISGFQSSVGVKLTLIE